MSYPRPLCENPQLIFNRKSLYNLLSLDGYFIDGVFHPVSSYLREVWRQDFPFKRFAKMAHSFESFITIDGQQQKIINWEALDNSYCGYDANGKKMYLFLAVPCGLCVLCTDKKQNDFVTRCNLENQSSETRPIMLTLTYAPPYLPFVKSMYAHYIEHKFDSSDVLFPDTALLSNVIPCDVTVKSYSLPLITRNVPYVKDESTKQYYITDETYKGFYPTLLKSDIQKFFKRLRIFWTRNNFRQTNLRYVCFGEYGHNTHRPHYHLILWNVPYDIFKPTDFDEVERLKTDILKCWKMCEPQSCQCEIARNAASYVSKYISKNMQDSDMNFGFRLASNRGGGIGYPFLSTQLEFLRNHPSIQKISYTDKWSGKFQQYTFGRYIHDKVFPSTSRLIPDAYKQVLRYDCYLLSCLSRMARAFSQSALADHCELISYEDNLLPSFLPHGFSYFADVPQNFLRAPMFTFFIDYYEEIINLRDAAWKSIDGITLPDERSLVLIQKLRNEHDTLFLHPDITDDVIRSKKDAILEKRAASLAKEIF